MWGLFENSKNVVDLIFKEPSKVTMIGSSAFDNCNLSSSLIIPDSVVEIQSGAFCYNPYLKSVTVGTGLIKMGAINDLSLDNDGDGSNNDKYTVTIGVFEYDEGLKVLVFKEP